MTHYATKPEAERAIRKMNHTPGAAFSAVWIGSGHVTALGALRTGWYVMSNHDRKFV